MPDNPWVLRSLVVAALLTVATVSLLAQINSFSTLTFGCTYSSSNNQFGEKWMPAQVSNALLHYATTTVIPQQSREEIELSVKVLAQRSPANFLVFGLGHDSPLWSALNFKGKTLFLEEDSNWIKDTLKIHPLKAFHVKYPTMLSQADDLLGYYRSDAACSPLNPLRASKCRLALSDLPQEVYDTEWDVIMIDAPRGYFDEAPGRMTAIFSAAVMAMNRKEDGGTDVFLHDVDRRVEKIYANEFLCEGNLVGYNGRLWHFTVPKMKGNRSEIAASSIAFCQS